jgi:5-methylcytosine-specific restriction endonuclease McrA
MKLCTFEYYTRKQGKQCAYCGDRLTVNNATRDHYIPKSLGGKGNIKLVCSPCNKSKANTHPQVYLEKIRKLFFNYYQKEICHI